MHRILVWAVIILITTNLSMAFSFLYFKRIPKTNNHSSEKTKVEMPAEKRTRFFREQLGLDINQLDSFRTFNRNFNFVSRGITFQLESLRTEMVTEMGKEKPDEIKLDSIANSIGMLHTKLKRLTIDYYLDMKRMCSKDQQEKLNAIFMSALKSEEDVKLPERGYGFGRMNK
jgi:hypothetical protein